MRCLINHFVRKVNLLIQIQSDYGIDRSQESCCVTLVPASKVAMIIHCLREYILQDFMLPLCVGPDGFVNLTLWRGEVLG
jgi:hypothetical protein